MVIEQEHPVLGKIRLPNLPFRFSDCDLSQKMPAPLLGQHNRAIASELGYVGSEVDSLVRDGVLYSEPAAAGGDRTTATPR
jgi:crotonobetainyl-CoA:carnitine CoA-transferase CaiB-like acyl-CoA transferase